MEKIKFRLKAFSLSELLVVLVIIGILVIIALPNLMPPISKAKATEAQQPLSFLHTLQQSYFYTWSGYSDSLKEIGFEQQPLVSKGGTANYVIEITDASESGFTARARAAGIFCMRLHHTGYLSYLSLKRISAAYISGTTGTT